MRHERAQGRLIQENSLCSTVLLKFCLQLSTYTIGQAAIRVDWQRRGSWQRRGGRAHGIFAVDEPVEEAYGIFPIHFARETPPSCSLRTPSRTRMCVLAGSLPSA